MSTSTLTYGQRLVRASFNPGDNDDVARFKKMTADIIDRLHAMSPSREISIAITQYENACMWAVKAATAPAPVEQPADSTQTMFDHKF